MDAFKKAIAQILRSAGESLEDVDPTQVERLIGAILRAEQVFVIGAGRSGLILKSFAMRLMHLGIPVYVVGETITPVIKKGDLALVLSGSGETSIIVSAAMTSKKAGAYLAAVTSYPDSTVGKMADLVVELRGKTKVSEEKDYLAKQIDSKLAKQAPLTPLGTLFETAAMVFFDSTIAELAKQMNKTEQEMKERHSNIS